MGGAHAGALYQTPGADIVGASGEQRPAGADKPVGGDVGMMLRRWGCGEYRFYRKVKSVMKVCGGIVIMLVGWLLLLWLFYGLMANDFFCL
ncbi:hypothetical protein EUQ69_20475 [Salmonella enterica subsp. enterica serovar Newport]|nr:hypothetical protein [Salmonella enterica subsp. enterica serovar Bispebjerg]EAA5301379.1 hypothetical protein [Salmonella enterica subsp. enterica serovar Manhattan]EAB5927735.1 hypothetical protein [Salmonella enterica subsp. enterica serovar Newport]EBX1108247.1 hypothetical protein [Salmonella enterica subsp. enterica serovar Salford]ECE6512175.1 hypothetical protein [Salmonella enterica subsp. enterica]MJY56476.1 hypothetical protein [Salmonella enterica subsp. enterica serovar Milwauk